MAHVRQSRPDSGLSFQVKDLETLSCVPFSFSSGNAPTLLEQRHASEQPDHYNVSSEFGTHKAVKAIFWPWANNYFAKL